MHHIAFMERLNGMASQLTITGCSPPVLQMQFGPSISFSGRIYALGGNDTYQNLPEAERQHITINGEKVVEVDINASSLSVFLGMMKVQDEDKGLGKPQDDPYQKGVLAGFRRDAVKHWFTSSLQGGRLKTRWSANTPQEVRTERCMAIYDAALTTYPALERLHEILPERERNSLPSEEYLPWAIGQYIACVESSIIKFALDQIMAQGGVALPLHDALLVPHSWADQAVRQITFAGQGRLMRDLIIEVKKKL
ncbi:hypothetical protein [Swingsia samuiensis]|uniref:Uncharacterized protein n=1 Tax=Swingsia samuiensis TaxID=1293412 RepID=A0A4Y6UJS8_9PROT|nr:hypothetical protein [Swingsia samuiensis]QDH16255.1 hypothetical protein E3D00_00700 [Swingsia samuiensis]